MPATAVSIENLGKRYQLRHQARSGGRKYTALRDVVAESVTAPLRLLRRRGSADPEETSSTLEEFWALRDVSFTIAPGESVGIIGRNGAGKSTLLKILSRITEPTTGRIEIEGRVSSLLEVGTGFHPELTGRENIYLNGTILGMKRREIRKKFDEIVAFSEVEKFLDTPVKHFSSGMYVRLAFAVAAHLEPDILIVDEVLAVGDTQFQKKCIGKMQSVSAQDGRTVIFVSHNMQAIRQMCGRVIFMEKGRLTYAGDPHVAISRYLGQGVDAESAASYELSNYPRAGSTEDAKFQQLRFLNGSGEPVLLVRLDDTLVVEVIFAAENRLREFNISMAVVHGEGLRVFSEVYSDQHALPDLEPGEYTVRFQVPMRFFKMESYFLNLTLANAGRHCDTVEGLLIPELVHDDPNLHVESHRWGVLRVPVKWDLVEPRNKSGAVDGIRS